MIYGDFKDLVRRTASDKVSRWTYFNGLYIFLIKNFSDGVETHLQLNHLASQNKSAIRD